MRIGMMMMMVLMMVMMMMVMMPCGYIFFPMINAAMGCRESRKDTTLYWPPIPRMDWAIELSRDCTRLRQ